MMPWSPIRRSLRLVLAVASGFSALGATQDAEAAWSKIHASDCHPMISYFAQPENNPNPTLSYVYGWMNGDLTHGVFLVCPATDDHTFPKQNATWAEVHVRDTPNDPVFARACVTYANGTGYSCGSIAATAPGANVESLDVYDTSKWSTYSTSFGHYLVWLPRTGRIGDYLYGSNLYGIKQYDFGEPK